MNELEFCYWLNGYFELSESDNLTPEQVKQIKEHLSLVFDKKTPPMGFGTMFLQGREIDVSTKKIC